MATITSTIKLIDQMTPTLNKISKAIDRVDRQSKAIGSAKTWNGFNAGVNTATKSTHNLYNAIRRTLFLLGTLRGLQGLSNISDTMMNANARINNITGDLAKTKYYMDAIYLSAQRSRASFTGTANSVGKLATLAGSAFNGNMEQVIAFIELMNKLFVISGASAAESSNAMYQLTQAMAAGKLQGDEMRSILENAPMLAQKLAEKLGVTTGELKQLGADGKITAEIIKEALFDSADEIEEKFENMPKTIGQTWTEICNYALNAFRPVISAVQNFINSPVFEKFKNRLFSVIDTIANGIIRLFELFETPRIQNAISKICTALNVLWDIVLDIGNLMVNVAMWICDNWNWIAPIVYTIAWAFLVYKAAIAVATVAMWAYNAAQFVAGLIAGTIVLTTFGLVVLIIVALIAGLYLAVAAWNHFTGQTVSATGIIFGAIAFTITAIGQLIMKIWDSLVWLGQALVALAVNFGAWIANVFSALGLSIVEIGINIWGTFEWLGAVISTWGSNMLTGMKQLCEALPGYWEYFKASVVAKFWGIIAGAVGAFNSLIQGSRDTCVRMLSPFADFANGVKTIINKIKNAWNSLCDSLSFSVSLPDWLGGYSWEWSASRYKVNVDETPITAEGWIGQVQGLASSVASKYAFALRNAESIKGNIKDVNWSTNKLPSYGDYADWGSVADAWNKGMNAYEYMDWPSYNVDWTDWQTSLDAWDKWKKIGADIENGITGVIEGIGGLLDGLFGKGSSDKTGAGGLTDGGGFGRFDGIVDPTRPIPESLEDLLGGSNGSSIPDSLGAIADNTGSSAGSASNIEDTLDLAEEELELLRKLAEQEVINRFTTAEIHVDMTNNNNVSSDMDLDGIVTHLSKKLYEELGVVASGVHY